MATRLEKIFRTNTICLMDSILNEINSVIENKKAKTTAKEWANVSKNITHSICGFYEKNNITDEEIMNAVSRGNKNVQNI